MQIGFGEAFELLQVVDVVACHGFYDGPEGHGSALGVGGWAVMVGFGDGGEEAEIPVAGRLKERKGCDYIAGGVALSPTLLIEGLNDGVVFSERLAQTEREDKLAVGEVGEDLADTPFTGGRRVVELVVGQVGGELMEMIGCRGKDRDWVLTVKEFCVWVEFHAETVSR